MSKKKKHRQISSEARTCFIFAAVFLICGIGCVIYGKTAYVSEKMVSPDDIVTGQTATVISVEKQSRNLSPSDKELEKKKGYSEDEIRWEYHVVYSVDVDGEQYTYDAVRRYRDDGTGKPHEGDTEVINYAIKDGRFIVHPETQGTNGTVIGGYILVILSVIALGIGLFLRK